MSVNVSGMIVPFFCLSMVEKVVDVVDGKQIEKHISHAGKMIGLIKWNKSPFVHLGMDSELEEGNQRKIEIPIFHRVKIRVNIKITERYGKQFTLGYLDGADPKQRLNAEQIQRILLTTSKTMDQLKERDNGEVIVIRAIKWRTISPLQLYSKTGKKTSRNVEIDGKVETREDEEIVEIDGGQEFVQMKHHTEENPVNIPCFSFSVTNEGATSLFLNMWNHQWGEPLIWLGGWDYMLNKTIEDFGNKKRPEEKSDPFSQIDNYLRGTELFIVGKIAWIKESRNARPDKDGNIKHSGSINISMICDLRFPHFEAEDRRMPPTVSEILSQTPDIPILMPLGEINDLYALPQWVVVPTDVSLDYSEVMVSKDESVDSLQPPEEDDEPIIEPIDNAEAREFRNWTLDIVKMFRTNDNAVHERDLGEPLVFALTETLNIYSPNPPHHSLTEPEKGISDDPENTLFNYWKKVVKKVAKTPTEKEKESSISKESDKVSDQEKKEEIAATTADTSQKVVSTDSKQTALLEEDGLIEEKPLEELTSKKLMKVAKAEGLKGYSRLVKEDLITAIIEGRKPLPEKDIKPDEAIPDGTEEIPKETKAIEEKQGEMAAKKNLSEAEQKEMNELEELLLDFILNSPTEEVTFEELFTNYRPLLPNFITKDHKPFIEEMIKKQKVNAKKELENNK
jgi:hypothetical protein